MNIRPTSKITSIASNQLADRKLNVSRSNIRGKSVTASDSVILSPVFADLICKIRSRTSILFFLQRTGLINNQLGGFH